MSGLIISWLLFSLTRTVKCDGLLLLYRPRDISTECAFSRRLRYDISFGMGMSDTITLVFRTLTEIDYECSVEIVTERWANIVVVVKYPTTLGINCGAYKDTITVMKKNKCLRLCDLIGERNLLSPFYVAVVNGRVRFRFLSNSSINSDINAHMYQVTATSARPQPTKGCDQNNETICVVNDDNYCFTSGVVCDGINNCGIADWFDERKSDCGLPIERLGYGPVIAVIAAIFCGLLAAGHILLRCLPPLANSFFIFNANEDNRLCIDPMFKSPGHRAQSIERVRRTSLIPILYAETVKFRQLKSHSNTILFAELGLRFLPKLVTYVSLTSSSASSQDNEASQIDDQTLSLTISGGPPKSTDEPPTDERSEEPHRKTTMRSIAEKIQNKFWKEKKPKSVVQI